MDIQIVKELYHVCGSALLGDKDIEPTALSSTISGPFKKDYVMSFLTHTPAWGESHRAKTLPW